MKRKFAAATSIAVVASLSLAACSGASTSAESPEDTGPVTLTLSGASLQLAAGGELDTIIKGFEAENPDVTIETKEYDSAQYTTLLSADFAAGDAPDLIWQNQVKSTTTWAQGRQLLDVSDIKATDVKGVDSYKVEGKTYAIPYRFDGWVLFYNKDLFDLAGVEYPDGTWTWDDYEDAAEELADGLAAAGSSAKAVYQHTWPQYDQAFATAQVPGADAFSGDYSYMKSYYERSLRMQDDGEQVSYNTAKANQLHYIPEFGTQKAAMLAMGSWYVGLFLADIAAGKSEVFNWGMAPAPQYNKKTTGLDNVPVTVGDPTGIAINAAIDKKKLKAAKAFLSYIASEDGANTLASTGTLPAHLTESVIDTWFKNDGVPGDDLSRFAISTYDAKPDNPQSPKWPAISTILADAHTAIISGAESVDSALKTAEDRVKNEVGVD